MSTKYTNLNYKELMELAPRDKPFQVVRPNKTIEWFIIPSCDGFNKLTQITFNYSIPCGKHVLNDKELYDLIIHHLDDTTLEKFQVGDKVEVLENAKEFLKDGNWYNYYEQRQCIGKIFKIQAVFCEEEGMNYTINNYTFPQNCLRKVVSKKPEPKTITIGDKTFEVSEELTNALKNLKPIK